MILIGCWKMYSMALRWKNSILAQGNSILAQKNSILIQRNSTLKNILRKW